MGTSSFAELGIDRLFLAGLSKMKVTRPSEIQAAAIPAILSSENVAMQSYTGSGKTLAFLLPAMTLAIARAETLFKAGEENVPLQLLVIAPSHELAMQIVRVAQGLLPSEHRKMVQQCIGGANPKRQEEAILMNKPIIVVGTPGRISEFIRLGALKIHRCPLMVLDEADQLLSTAFVEDMNHIATHCGKALLNSSSRRDTSTEEEGQQQDQQYGRQTVLVSATLSESVLSKMSRWCHVRGDSNAPHYVTLASSPAPRISEEQSLRPTTARSGPAWGWGVHGWDGPASEVAPKTLSSAGGVEGSHGLVPTLPPQLRHLYLVVDPRHKPDALRRCIHALDAQRVLIFMNYQQRLKDTMFKLEARKMKVASLHGEMEKLARANILNDFRRGRMRALVVSDVVARGLDISECDAVFNAELPSSAAHYAHRAGRTGRMETPGTVVSLVLPAELFVIEKLSKSLGVPILEAHVSFGQLELGPPPASHRYDEDEEDVGRIGHDKAVIGSSKDRPIRGARAPTQAAVSVSQGKRVSVAASTDRSDAAMSRNEQQAGSRNVPKRGRSSEVANCEERSMARDDSDYVEKSAPLRPSSKARYKSEAAQRLTSSKASRDPVREEEDQEDGEEMIDVKQLESQVRKAKTEARGRAPSVTNSKLSSRVREELKKELGEVMIEKSSAKSARKLGQVKL
ncbi:hypothetical protein CEUSTIGMA_g7462.t1 [Chlamydomonas eustigma]|uniref:RNA helicase n=1 Tax=Chlamydomonas eustigma TaxID=1157962 RepID=A0A250XA80_9CHLO|nr:hypothetical protein CEUSTIGMA_g7462.t1 [Chlamydomonas eustigma]|eukprot:GAX80023.1 hypothetical protein CEUSTIGMA_g7462.t1 [Chlamydomonas eustigma]